jgi:hypothetical protein
MNIEQIIHASDFSVERELIDREVEKNINGKLDAYLKKYDKTDSIVRIEVFFTRDKKKAERSQSTVSGKIKLTADGKNFLSEREGFEKLEDLIHHLFTHIKEQLAK